MEQPEQHIDHVFNNKLAHASVPPPAFVWSNVEKELHRRKKPPFFWWWTSSLALLLVAGGVYFLQESGQSAGIASLTTAKEAVVQQNTTAIADAPGKKNDVADFATPANINPENAGDAAFAPYTKKSTAGSIGKDINAKGGGLRAPEMNIPASAVQTPEIIIANTIIIPGPQQETAIETKTALPFLPGLKTDFFESKIVGPSAKRWPTKVAKKKKKDENCYDFASHRTVFMLDAYIGPETADRSFTAENAENKPYLAKRQQTEGRGWGFNGGLRATALFNGHFTASAGIQYDQFTEAFKLREIISTDTLFIVHHDLQTGEYYKEIKDIIFGERVTRVYNRYGFLDIPVHLGYEIRRGRGGVRLQGGASLNLIFYKRGSILSPDTDTPVVFSPGKPAAIDVFKSNAGLSVQGSMQFFWSYAPRTRFFVEPYFKKILDPVTVDNHPVSTRYNLWGARFGVTKIF